MLSLPKHRKKCFGNRGKGSRFSGSTLQLERRIANGLGRSFQEKLQEQRQMRKVSRGS